MLLQLLHVLSGEDLGPMSRGRLKINQLENVGKALAFLKEKDVGLNLHNQNSVLNWMWLAA